MLPKTLRLNMPQWQGGTEPAYRFGAELLRWLAPAHPGPEETVDVPAAGNQPLAIEQGIKGRTTLLSQARAARAAIERHQPDRIVTLGGDCLVDLAPMAYLNRRYDGKLGVLWVDAHPDVMSSAEFSHAHVFMVQVCSSGSGLTGEVDMAGREHDYRVSVTWTGNKGSGTSGYKTYSRDHTIAAPDKTAIPGSSDPAFLGDRKRWNPEDLLVASASACHQLWYLHLCAEAGISVIAYVDEAEGTMVEGDRGRFTRIVLRPKVTLRAGDDAGLAARLHHEAHEKCFIANSLNFPVLCEPSFESASALD